MVNDGCHRIVERPLRGEDRVAVGLLVDEPAKRSFENLLAREV